ncbi:hypothetical protein [Vibrio parahaemolyticus]|uniref:hypothetical protein n=1 Tax=Vibrio parahaemolyticus TaxID=670 RepID=UPI0004DEE07C|nr:hypothetical protein [Vibrio parahaemolyticus]MDN2654703.1 hypothetical protein [Vibrio parahaemolyticus]
MFKNIKLSKVLFCIFIVAFFLIITAVTVYFLNFNGSMSNEHERWGTFGDFLGGVLNPALSFLALIALLLTLLLQNRQAEISVKELQLSRTELVDSRMELSRSAKAQEESGKHQSRQVKVQELSTRISVITLLLEQDGKGLREDRGSGVSISTINVRDIIGTSKKELLKELGDIYKELKKLG